jgi:hypothetical protein
VPDGLEEDEPGSPADGVGAGVGEFPHPRRPSKPQFPLDDAESLGLADEARFFPVAVFVLEVDDDDDRG